jgi:hypothetical protein
LLILSGGNTMDHFLSELKDELITVSIMNLGDILIFLVFTGWGIVNLIAG